MGFEELVVYLGNYGNLVFVCAVVTAYLLLESIFPLYPHRMPPLPRWTVNVGLHVINSLMAYFILIYLFGMRVEETVAGMEFGLFYWVEGIPFWLQTLVFVLCADLAFYWLHRAMHTWRPLWRAHVVHHSDLDVDITDSFRGHPFQILLEMGMRLLLTFLFGVPLLSLIVYDVLYQVFVFFPHANLRVPPKMDWLIRLVVVTPDMHRVHHSAREEETNSNYSDIFSFWDRMFGTYRFMTPQEQKHMPLGLEYFRSPKERGLIAVLMQPFVYNPDHGQPLPGVSQEDLLTPGK